MGGLTGVHDPANGDPLAALDALAAPEGRHAEEEHERDPEPEGLPKPQRGRLRFMISK